MKKDYLINILGTMEQEGEQDTVQLMIRGSFARRNGKYFIRYREAEDTGLEGNITTVKVEDEARVSMTRAGDTPSELVIEKGRRHVCHYDSGYGVLSLGVAADSIQNHLTEDGGDVTFSYTLDSGNTQISHNEVKITVREA